MMTAASPCRTYIVYHHGLFAQGVRSVLEARGAIEIVGMESDVGKALKAVQSLRPEVIIVEECTGTHQRMRLGALMHSAGSGRVVTLSLDHEFATVYQRKRITATDPAELVQAIQGVGKKQRPGPDPHPGRVGMAALLESGPGNHNDNADHEPRVRRIRKPGKKCPIPSRASCEGKRSGS
jgi:chemotaxis response regulator CheB